MSIRTLIDDISGIAFDYEVKGYDFVESTPDEPIYRVQIYASRGALDVIQFMKAKEIVAEFLALKKAA